MSTYAQCPVLSSATSWLTYGTDYPASYAVAGDPIFRDVGVSTSGVWYKATSTTSIPFGVSHNNGLFAARSGTIAALTGLTAGATYYMADNGGLTTTVTNVKIGVALSSTLLYVDIHYSGRDYNPIGYGGWVIGGYTATTIVTTTDRWSFYTDARAASTAVISPARLGLCGVSTPTSSGYLFGGIGTGSVYYDYITYVNYYSGSGNLSVSLSGTRGYSGGASSNTACYVGGGMASDGTTALNVVQKLTFSLGLSPSVSVLGTTLSTARWMTTGLTAATAGYFAGGSTSSSVTSAIDKLSFSTDTSAVLGAGIARGYGAGTVSSTAGYVSGGYLTPSTITNTIIKLTFSTDTTSTLAATLASSKTWAAGYESRLAGYVAGGSTTTTTRYSTTDKITYATDTVAAVSAISSARGAAAGLSSK